MAATDYYSSPPPPPPPAAPAQHSFLAPPSQPQRASSHSGFVYPQPNPVYPQPNSAPNSSPHHRPQVPPPPPYQSPLDQGSKPTVHFTPSLTPLQQRSSFSHPQRPNPQTWNQPYPPQQQSLAPPTSYPNTGPYVPQPYAYQQHPTAAPFLQPYMHSNNSEGSLESGYSSDPEQHRRRRRKSKETGRERGHSTGGSRSINTDGFLGAAGGGLIGDLIFPGLGTVGGALAGWFGGKDYGNHRKWREQKREKEQREWERMYGSRQRDHGVRSKSHERRRSHE